MRGLGLVVLTGLVALVAPATAGASNLPAGELFPLGCAGDANPDTPCSTMVESISSEAAVVGPNDGVVYTQGIPSLLIAMSRGEDGRLSYLGCNAFQDECGAANTMPSLIQGTDGLVAGPNEIYFAGNTNVASGAVGAGRVRADGTLEEISCFVSFAQAGCTVIAAIEPANGIAISPDFANVYSVAGGSNDAILTFSRGDDGALSYVECHALTAGPCGAGQVAQGMDNPSDVTVSPDGQSVYVSTFGPDFSNKDGTVAAFDRAEDGGLSPNGCVENTGSPATCAGSMPGLADPSAIEASNQAVYVTSRHDFDGVDSAIATLPRNTDGSLEAGTCIAATGSNECGGATAPGVQSPFELVLSPDGSTLHASAAGSLGPALDGAVTTFAVGAGGALTPLSCVAGDAAVVGCGASQPGLGTGATGVAITADGLNVYAASDAIVELGREAAPVCSDSVASTKGVSVAVRLPCGDANGDALTYAAPTPPEHGKLGALGSVGQASYRPTPGYVGPDSFTFTATGGILTTAPSTARITVTNRRPAIRKLRVRRGRARFRLTEPARVTLTFARKKVGRKGFRKVGRKLKLKGKTGNNARKLPKRVRLNPGAYRLSARARDPQGLRSKLAKRKFKLKS